MAVTDPVTTTGVANNANKTGASTIKLAEDFQQFLTLLTTQLQNQDPLSPMDSTEFTNQLVQFAQVEQQINQNQKLDNLVSLQLASISSVALGYVGMDISYISSDMNYEGKPVQINYALASEATTAKINIYDEAGTLVYSGDAPKDTGTNSFTWNGTKTNGDPLSHGTYTVKIDAIDGAGKAIENSTVVTGNVRGIETQNGIVYVLVGDRAVALSSIVNANSPGAAKSGANVDAALGYVNMDVTYKSDALTYNASPVTFNYSLDQKAASSKIKIYDDAGKLVYITNASQMTGTNSFTWNGQKTDGSSAPAGEYTIEVDAVTQDGNPINTTTSFSGHVTGVEQRASVNYVLIGDKAVPASSILTVKTPTTNA